MNKKMWWGLCSLLGLTSAMKVNEFKKNKKRKKMGELWKRFFLIEEEYTVVTKDRMIEKND